MPWKRVLIQPVRRSAPAGGFRWRKWRRSAGQNRPGGAAAEAQIAMVIGVRDSARDSETRDKLLRRTIDTARCRRELPQRAGRSLEVGFGVDVERCGVMLA